MKMRMVLSTVSGSFVAWLNAYVIHDEEEDRIDNPYGDGDLRCPTPPWSRSESLVLGENQWKRRNLRRRLRASRSFGCAENVDWLFDQFGTGVSREGLDDAVSAAERGGYPQVAQTLRARACVLS